MQYRKQNLKQCQRTADGKNQRVMKKKRIMQPWTEEELTYLKENWPEIGSKTAEHLKKHTLQSVRQRAKELGLRTKNYYWSKKDEIFLKENYDRMSMQELASHFGRDEASIRYHLLVIGVAPTHKSKPHSSWNNEEDEYLKKHCRHMSDTEIANFLGKTRKAVEDRRRHFGIKKDLTGKKLIVDHAAKKREQNPLTDTEKAFIKENGASMTDAAIAEKLGRSKTAVANYRYSSGIRKPRPHKRNEEPVIGLSWADKKKGIPALKQEQPAADTHRKPEDHDGGWTVTEEKFLKRHCQNMTAHPTAMNGLSRKYDILGRTTKRKMTKNLP